MVDASLSPTWRLRKCVKSLKSAEALQHYFDAIARLNLNTRNKEKDKRQLENTMYNVKKLLDVKKPRKVKYNTCQTNSPSTDKSSISTSIESNNGNSPL